MIPDERMRRAMHSLQPDDVDAPDLYGRVARGARRRGQLRVGGAMFGVVAVVCAAAVIPAALSGGSSPTSVSTVGGDIDPGFTGVSPSPSGVSPTPTTSLLVPPASPSRIAITPATPTALPKNSSGCPTVDSLPPGPNAVEQARAAALAAVPQRYGKPSETVTVTTVYPAASGQRFGVVADGICGKALGDNSYVVELGFADSATVTSASMGSGQLFVANFPGAGWQVWFQYH